MVRAMVTSSRQPGTGSGAAHGAFALALAGLIGCSHTSSSLVPHLTVEQVERTPDGTHLTLSASENEPGVLAVTAVEQAMCRDEERGMATFSTLTVATRDSTGNLGGAPPLLLLALLPIILTPRESVNEAPSGEPPVPYRQWRGERMTCGEPAQPVPDLPLRLVTRLNETTCLEWRTATAADGTLARLPSLDRTTAQRVSCERPVEPGCLWIEPIKGVVAPGASEPPAAHRTRGQLVVSLSPSAVEALGLADPPSGKLCSQPWQAHPLSVEQVGAIRACTSKLAPTCFTQLVNCLVGDGELCWSSASRCDPLAPEFNVCMADRTLAGSEPTAPGR